MLVVLGGRACVRMMMHVLATVQRSISVDVHHRCRDASDFIDEAGNRTCSEGKGSARPKYAKKIGQGDQPPNPDPN